RFATLEPFVQVARSQWPRQAAPARADVRHGRAASAASAQPGRTVRESRAAAARAAEPGGGGAAAGARPAWAEYRRLRSGAAAASAMWPETREQRCWNHKLVNVLDQLPKKVQAMGREMLCAIPYAPTRAEALKRRERFAKAFRRTHPKAVEILEKDWERMVAFYEFPKEHWKHLRTTNVVESPVAAVRLRTDAAKRFKKTENAT